METPSHWSPMFVGSSLLLEDNCANGKMCLGQVTEEEKIKAHVLNRRLRGGGGGGII